MKGAQTQKYLLVLANFIGTLVYLSFGCSLNMGVHQRQTLLLAIMQNMKLLLGRLDWNNNTTQEEAEQSGDGYRLRSCCYASKNASRFNGY